MLFKKKNRFKPLYKQLINLGENIYNSQKILKFKRKKWSSLINILKRKLKKYKKFKPQNQSQYLISKYPNKWTSYKKGRHKNTLQAFKKFKLLYGNYNKKKIKFFAKQTLKSTNSSKNLNLIFLKLFETKLDIVLYRAKFSLSIRAARQLIAHGGVLVNNVRINNHSYTLKPGDFISIVTSYSKQIEKSLARSNIWPIPPKHLTINYKTLQLFFGTIESTNMANYFNFNLNLERLLVDYLK